MPLHLQAFLMILAQDITIGIGYKTMSYSKQQSNRYSYSQGTLHKHDGKQANHVVYPTTKNRINF
jgi:hypothetical protein